ncbi:helix-turn-helix transcriptional regulator [Myroides phaeus]|uniref:AraC-type DNA-binding protein n=1 Tax=Myroides phaeus TaxID=702745 RepID=A0A1G8FDF1_9FLAO|nr:helix-turn-helix transcriptional regulator [Myroides phaeus]MEC4116559.1 helix-turn-helix transcriptional regulator [Myroides phaeus]SDH80125.1 AraC-type DNA-binding protein [Myroides phaeus]
MSPTEEIIIDEHFSILRFENTTQQSIRFEREMGTDVIQFYFGLKGNGKFIFNQGAYALALNEDKSLILYNPQKKLPVHLEIAPNTWIISVLISIKKFHSLFSTEAEFIGFLTPENQDKKYYGEEDITPSMAIVLNQLFNFYMNPSIKKLYYTGKTYELLSLLFNQNEDQNLENCPFLSDEDDVVKIKKAKDIIISKMAEPPTLQELADMVGINIKKLKLGFKQIYGDSVFSFLFDYKMEYARKLLDNGSYNVNEVGLKIGYSSASHFIAAFKKKFGTTPKKYLMSLNSNN